MSLHCLLDTVRPLVGAEEAPAAGAGMPAIASGGLEQSSHTAGMLLLQRSPAIQIHSC